MGKFDFQLWYMKWDWEWTREEIWALVQFCTGPKPDRIKHTVAHTIMLCMHQQRFIPSVISPVRNCTSAEIWFVCLIKISVVAWQEIWYAWCVGLLVVWTLYLDEIYFHASCYINLKPDKNWFTQTQYHTRIYIHTHTHTHQNFKPDVVWPHYIKVMIKLE